MSKKKPSIDAVIAAARRDIAIARHELAQAAAERERITALLAAENAKFAAEETKIAALLKAQAELHEARLASLSPSQRKLLAELTSEQALHPTVNSRNLPSEQMQADSRSLAISKGRKARDQFLVAIRERGFTLRSLAAAVGTPPSLLSMQRGGDRPIPRNRAEQIEKLTGWPADTRHWPGGIS